MEYVLLDNFNGNLNIICKDDDSGEPMVFTNLKEAEEASEENCQDGVVIPLGTNIIQILRNCEAFISMASDEELVDHELTKELDEILDLKGD